MYCTHCGQQLDDNAVICVNCGVATRNFNVIQEARNVVQEKKINGLGLAGFIVSLLSLYFGAYFFVSSIVGLTLSIVGMVKAKNCRLNGFAIAGLVLGIISLLFWLIMWIAFFAVIIASY